MKLKIQLKDSIIECNMDQPSDICVIPKTHAQKNINLTIVCDYQS